MACAAPLGASAPMAGAWNILTPLGTDSPCCTLRRIGRMACCPCGVVIVEDEPLIGAAMEMLVEDMGGQTFGPFMNHAASGPPIVAQ